MTVAAAFVAIVLAVLTPALAAFGIAGLVALIRGFIELRRLIDSDSDNFIALLLKSPLVPGVSVIFTPDDSTPTSRARLRKLLDLEYGKHEVVLVAGDADMAPWTTDFHLVERDPGRYVSTEPIKLAAVAMPEESLAARINAGIKAAQYPVLAFVDPVAEFVPQLLLHLIRPMIQEPGTVVAVCAMAPPDPGPGLLSAVGALETARLWLVRCAAFAAWHNLIPVHGSSFLVRRRDALRTGGVQSVPADLFLAFPPGSRAAFLPRRVSWPPAPQSWNDLQARVESDQRALAALKPEGREGRALFAVRFLRPLLETIALVFAAIGLAAGWIGWPLAGLVLLSTAVMGMVTSMTALVLREFAQSTTEPAQLATLFRAAIVENLGYRQIRNLWLIRTWLR